MIKFRKSTHNKNMGIFHVNFKKLIIETLEIISGTAILAVGVSLFLLPNQLSSGGFSGLATIFYYLIKTPIGATMLALNVPLFIMALMKKGKKFLLNAIIGTVVLSFFLDIFEQFKPVTADRFLACIYGGILTGTGTAIVLKANASTGGTDLLSNIVRIYKPTLKTSNLIVIFDIVIVVLNMIFFKTLEVGLYSAITIYIMGKMIDIFFEGINFTKAIYIISEQNEEISNRISNEIKRGSTLIYGKGMYKKAERNILMCIASRGEVRQIRQIINKVDKKAFVIISNTREVFGEGFKE